MSKGKTREPKGNTLNIKSKQIEQPQPPKPNIRLTVISAHISRNIEEGGSKMDPYVKIKYVDKDMKELFEVQTQVDMDGGQTPQWDQAFELTIEDLTKDLLIELWEWDKNSSDDYLGGTKISMYAALEYSGSPFQLEILLQNKPFAIMHLRVEQTRKSAPEDEEFKIIMKDQNVINFTKYIQDTGLERAFQLIFVEILTKKLDKSAAFTYAAVRLRQIGNDLKPLFQNKNNTNQFLNNISEVQEQEDVQEQ